MNYLPFVLALAIAGLFVVVLIDDIPSSGKANASPEESMAIRSAEALLAGIPQHGAALGNPKAPVTLQFFGDLQCVDSRRVMLGALPFLIRHWVRDGKLRVVYRSTMTDTLDRNEFLKQQIAALAAGRQERAWTFIDIFYREQRPEFTSYADEAFLEGIARQAGVSMLSWEEERVSGGFGREIESDELVSENREMDSTPSFLIGPTGGAAHRLRHFSFEEPKVFDEAIREAL